LVEMRRRGKGFQRRGARAKGVTTSPARVAVVVVVAAAVEHLERVVHRHCMRAGVPPPDWSVREARGFLGGAGGATAMAKHATTTTAAGGA